MSEVVFDKLNLMHCLEERVARLGVCPKCHNRMLKPIVRSGGYNFQQCSECCTVYVTDLDDLRPPNPPAE